MSTRSRWFAVAVLAGVAAFAATRGAPGPTPRAAAAGAGGALPRLVDLGAGSCVPCKAMAPVLDELRAEYAGRMEVVFIDVWQERAAAEPFHVRMIPTQVFVGADGRELGRHEGFMGKAEILARWESLGVSFGR